MLRDYWSDNRLMGLYAVITCDIIESRYLIARDEVQQQIEAGFNRINARFAGAIAIPFQFTLGDEFQGVLSVISKAPEIAGRLREEIAPVDIRIAIGIGEIATALSEDIRRVDGPAFRIARTVMEDLKRKQREPLRQKHRLTGLEFEQGRDDIVDTTYMLYDVIINERTDRQWWAARAYNSAGSVKRAAETFGTSPQNISKQLNAAHVFETNQAERSLGSYLHNKLAIQPVQPDVKPIVQPNDRPGIQPDYQDPYEISEGE